MPALPPPAGPYAVGAGDYETAVAAGPDGATTTPQPPLKSGGAAPAGVLARLFYPVDPAVLASAGPRQRRPPRFPPPIAAGGGLLLLLPCAHRFFSKALIIITK